MQKHLVAHVRMIALLVPFVNEPANVILFFLCFCNTLSMKQR